MAKKAKTSMSYEEWITLNNKPNKTDAEHEALDTDMDLWWRENRVKNAIYMTIGFILLPPAMAYDWIVRRAEYRRNKAEN